MPTPPRTISICIPTFNRFQLAIDSFAQVLDDERIAQVILVDDASTDLSYERLRDYFSDNNKVEVFQNKTNKDCYANKRESIFRATSDWCILLDSDNTITKEYLDAIYKFPEWDLRTIFQPQFARPHFDFRKHTGTIIFEWNIASFADTNLMTALNAMNFFINRKEYLKVWDDSVNPGSSDSLYFSYCWLRGGNNIYITPGLEYDHYISTNNDGHYQTQFHKYVDFHEQLMNKIRELK